MKNYIRLVEMLSAELGALSAESEKEKQKITQNQQRLDRLEQLGLDNEKEKVRQNQLRLDNLERTVRAQKREIDILLNAAVNKDSGVKRFNFLDKTTNSQSGEDAILAYVVSRLGIPFDECTYLDLGANRPVEGSNTNFFYNCGARGVLVEANPELIPDLEKVRSEDTVLNCCVDTEDGVQREFIIMTDDGLSTTDPDEIGYIQAVNPDIKVKSRVMVESITINTIMERYFPAAPVICSIDVEGKDLELLQSIDFEKYRPLLLVAEMIEYSNDLAVNSKNEDIYAYMKSVGYEEYAFTGINSIFIDTLALKEKWNYKTI